MLPTTPRNQSPRPRPSLLPSPQIAKRNPHRRTRPSYAAAQVSRTLLDVLPLDAVLNIMRFIPDCQKLAAIKSLIKLSLMQEEDIPCAMDYTIQYQDFVDRPDTPDYLSRMRAKTNIFRSAVRTVVVGEVRSTAVRRYALSLMSAPRVRRVSIPALTPFLRAVGRCHSMRDITIVLDKRFRIGSFNALNESPPLENVRDVLLLRGSRLSNLVLLPNGHIRGCLLDLLEELKDLLLVKFPKSIILRAMCSCQFYTCRGFRSIFPAMERESS